VTVLLENSWARNVLLNIAASMLGLAGLVVQEAFAYQGTKHKLIARCSTRALMIIRLITFKVACEKYSRKEHCDLLKR